MKTSAAPGANRHRDDREWHELARRIRDGSFVREGIFVAFPPCFPGVTDPIPHDEGRIVALAADGEGQIYGATAGRAHHVFFASMHGTGGIVLDLRWPDPSSACPAIACGTAEVLFAANGSQGGRLFRRRLQPRPGDLLHEWSFAVHPFHAVEEAVWDGPVRDLAVAADRSCAIGATATEIFRYDFAEGRIADRKAHRCATRLCSAFGSIWGLGEDGRPWQCDPSRRELEIARKPRAEGTEKPDEGRWAADVTGRFAYWMDGDGRLFSLSPDGALRERARLAIRPITAAAVAPDGRLFAFAGEGIAHFHVFEPATGSLRDLGAAVSVLERRRYGFAFAAAVPGHGGELYFGEDDTLGHLWLYFPTLPVPSTE
jgi:hypothetical protein